MNHVCLASLALCLWREEGVVEILSLSLSVSLQAYLLAQKKTKIACLSLLKVGGHFRLPANTEMAVIMAEFVSLGSNVTVCWSLADRRTHTHMPALWRE